MKTEQILTGRWCSPLAKVFPGEAELSAAPYRRCTVLRGATASFQLAYRLDAPEATERVRLQSLESPFGEGCLTVRQVACVPVDFPVWEPDDDYLNDGKPGLYPDVLQPLPPGGDIPDSRRIWHSLWFKLSVPKDFRPGKYRVKAAIQAGFYGKPPRIAPVTRQFELEVEVLSAVLPSQRLIYTNWFHCDCLADYYHVPVFSEEHWRIIGNFMRSAVEHGMNMVLTPLFTPPLDTDIGAERPTVQLIGVTRRRGQYQFDFSRLERWLDTAKRNGIKYFEMSHLVTQWGAQATPKVMATVDGRQQRIFGWDVASDSREYQEFLEAFLPLLAQFLRQKRLVSRTYFHCSDEPHPDHLEKYAKASRLIRRLLPGFKFMDALSHLEYYQQGLISIPVPLIASLETFVAAGVPDVWTYTCCGPTKTYTNRFIAMPSARNRILGAQLYYYRVAGFLHWGFDFYYKRNARGLINPYLTQSGEGVWPAGDPFVVYPGPGGEAVDSLRLEVLSDAFQDQRLLQLLEETYGREKIARLLDASSPSGKFSTAEYPRGEAAFLKLQEQLFRLARKIG